MFKFSFLLFEMKNCIAFSEWPKNKDLHFWLPSFIWWTAMGRNSSQMLKSQVRISVVRLLLNCDPKLTRVVTQRGSRTVAPRFIWDAIYKQDIKKWPYTRLTENHTHRKQFWYKISEIYQFSIHQNAGGAHSPNEKARRQI